MRVNAEILYEFLKDENDRPKSLGSLHTAPAERGE